MGGKNRAKPKSQQAASADTPLRRNFLKVAGAATLAFAAIFALYSYDARGRTLHDLGVVGGGAPVVVQIHDPSCALCRRLKASSTKALVDTDNVLYRLADITTTEGKNFQSKYGVPHVTLLLFNEKGRHIATSQGVKDPVELKQLFSKHFGS